MNSTSLHAAGRIPWPKRLPWDLVAVSVALVIVGCLGIARSEEFAQSDGRFLQKQLVWCGLAVAAMLLTAVPNYRVFGRYSYLAFAAALSLLVLVYFAPRINGAHRWLRVGPVGFQPSEVAKLAFILMLARYLMYRRAQRHLVGLIVPLGLTMIPVLLILKEPDLGTALVFLPILFLMLFAAGSRTGDLVYLAAIGLAILPLLWTHFSREQQSRVTAMFDQSGPSQRPSDEGYHLHQAKRMLAMGGVWGSSITGDTAIDPSAYHLPEDHTDFVICVVGERFGLWGVGLVLLLSLVYVWRGLAIAQRTREPFGRLVAIGLVALFGVQVLINTAMSVGLAPITGLPLPLVSYGGSGLLTQAVALGLLVNIGMRPGYEITKEPFLFAAT